MWSFEVHVSFIDYHSTINCFRNNHNKKIITTVNYLTDSIRTICHSYRSQYTTYRHFPHMLSFTMQHSQEKNFTTLKNYICNFLFYLSKSKEKNLRFCFGAYRKRFLLNRSALHVDIPVPNLIGVEVSVRMKNLSALKLIKLKISSLYNNGTMFFT